MGGLIAKDALAQSRLRSEKSLAVTLITLATPFRGSDLADALTNLGHVSSEHVDTLTTRHPLQMLRQEEWDDLRKACGVRLAHFAAYEGKPVKGLWVVKRQSALDGKTGREFPAEDHLSIAAPESRDSAVYKAVREWILERQASYVTFPQVPPQAFDDHEQGKRYTLKKGKIEVTEDIRIPAGATLRIEPGAHLIFKNGAILESMGKIDAEGAETDPKAVYGSRRSGGRAGPGRWRDHVNRFARR